MEIIVGYGVIKYWGIKRKIAGRRIFSNSLNADEYCKELNEDNDNKEVTYRVKEIGKVIQQERLKKY